MSSPQSTPAPLEPKKQSGANRIIWFILAPILLVLGIWQVYRGVNQMFGSGIDPQVSKLIGESDQAFNDARNLTAAAAPQYTALLGDVDKLGLDAVHKQRPDAAKTLSDQYVKATAGFRQAAAKLADAQKINTNDKVKPFLEGRAKAYELFAQECEKYQQTIALLMDASITKTDDLLPQLKQLTDARNALEKQAEDGVASADQAIGATKPAAKP